VKLRKLFIAFCIGMLAIGAVKIISSGPDIAFAQSQDSKRLVDQAKTDGIVGETVAGYLALVTGRAEPDIVNAMNDINIRRKAVYTQLARDRNVSIDVVAKLTGEKLIAEAPKGQKVLDENGSWKTK